MVQTLQAQTIDLRYLKDNFKLQRVREPDFFREWQENLPQLTDSEKEQLDKIQQGYFNLIEYPTLLENVVKLSIISPLLFIAGFYLPPFHIKAEKSIAIYAQDEQVKIEGRIDILILREKLWATLIDSKQLAFSLEEGLPQLLVYMLSDPEPKTPTFGMISNGVNFRFVKLVYNEIPQYALSDEFIIDNQNNELYNVLQILKKLAGYS